MNDETPRRAPWRFAPRSILTGSGLLSGLGSAIGLATSADARRGNKQRLEEQRDRKDSDDRGDNQQKDGGKEEKQRNNAKDEENNKNAKNDRDNKDNGNKNQNQDQNQDQNADRKDDRGANDRDNERRNQKDEEANKDRASDDDGGSRREHRRELKQEADSSSSSDDDAQPDHGDSYSGYRSHALYQPVHLPQTTAVDIVPDISNADLVVEGNPEVIAGVSGQGGFAFARSGEVTAFTGPDGAVIIQSEPVGTSPPPPPPPSTEPGGDNNTDFSS